MIGKMEDVCLVKIGRSDHKFEWLVGSVYMNCEGVRKEANILKLEYIKEVIWRTLDDGLGIMIGGDMNAHIWELDSCENENTPPVPRGLVKPKPNSLIHSPPSQPTPPRAKHIHMSHTPPTHLTSTSPV